MTNLTSKTEILNSYTLAENETVFCIENFESCNYKIYAVYVNGEYDRKILIAKN